MEDYFEKRIEKSFVFETIDVLQFAMIVICIFVGFYFYNLFTGAAWVMALMFQIKSCVVESFNEKRKQR